MRISHDSLVDKGLNANYNKSHNIISFFCTHGTAHFAPLYMVLAPVGTLDSTRGRAVAVSLEPFGAS